MLEKWNKYYDDPNPGHIIAHILDPSYKLDFLISVHGERAAIAKFRAMIKSCYEAYCLKHIPLQITPLTAANVPAPAPHTPAINTIAGQNNSKGMNRPSLLFKKDKSIGLNSPNQMFLELDSYLGGVVENDSITPMPISEWWSINSIRYPTLSKFAGCVLAVPGTSVPCESTFSRSGRVVSAHRSNLAPTTVQGILNKFKIFILSHIIMCIALMLWGNWLKGKNKFGFKTY